MERGGVMEQYPEVRDTLKVKLPREITANIIKTFLCGIDHEYKIGNFIIPNIIKESAWEFPNIYVEWDEIFKLRKYIIHHFKNAKKDKLDNLVKALEDIWEEG